MLPAAGRLQPRSSPRFTVSRVEFVAFHFDDFRCSNKSLRAPGHGDRGFRLMATTISSR